MFYNEQNQILRIVGVEHMVWGEESVKVAPRGHTALAFRIKGSAVIGCNGKEHTVNPTDILYMPQGLGYTAEYTDTEMIVFHFITANNDKNAEVYSLNNSEEVYRLFLKARALWKNKEPAYNLYIMSLLYKVLGIIAEKETKKALPAHFLKAVSVINTEFKDNSLSVDDVCKKAGIGATVFRALFKKHYGKSPVQYITELRIEHARNLISSGFTVESAAYDSGFNDAKYFARVVKKHLNCTPRELKTFGK